MSKPITLDTDPDLYFLTEAAELISVQVVNLPLFDVPLSHFIMRPSIAVPRPSVFQTASD